MYIHDTFQIVFHQGDMSMTLSIVENISYT